MTPRIAFSFKCRRELLVLAHVQWLLQLNRKRQSWRNVFVFNTSMCIRKLYSAIWHHADEHFLNYEIAAFSLSGYIPLFSGSRQISKRGKILGKRSKLPPNYKIRISIWAYSTISAIGLDTYLSE